jgi:hypothetical protein
MTRVKDIYIYKLINLNGGIIIKEYVYLFTAVGAQIYIDI